MTMAVSEVPTLRTNLAEYAVTKALRDGQVSSDVVKLDFCGPTPAHSGFKSMVRENAFDAGELAIVTFLQAKAYGKPYVLLPAPISGRFQHHCAGFNIDFGHLDPKDIEGKRVGVRTYTQTTALWIRGILRHEYGVDLDKVMWMTLNDGHLAEYSDPANCQRLPKGSSIPDMMLQGELAAALLGKTCRRIRACVRSFPTRRKRRRTGLRAKVWCPSTICSWFMRTSRGSGRISCVSYIGWLSRAAARLTCRPCSRLSDSRPTARASSWRSTGRSISALFLAACRWTNCSTT